MKPPHKYDIGVYTVETFTGLGRKRRLWIVGNYTQGQSLALRWKRRTGGSAVVRSTLFNTEQARRKW
jgi:hypothetical protein